MSRWNLSVDTGGTFTDCFCESPEGSLKRLKILSNSTLRGSITGRPAPDKLSIEATWDFDPQLLTGYRIRLLPGGEEYTIRNIREGQVVLDTQTGAGEYAYFEIVSGEEVPLFAARLLTGTLKDQDLPPLNIRLGTTRGTNALLERAGADVVFLTTKGFADLLLIGNQQRPELFALDVTRKDQFYRQVFEAEERMDAHGEVLQELSENECKRLLEELKSFDPEKTAIAIAFLHAHRNPVHEERMADYLSRAGFTWISCSSAISSNSKILHRAETAVVNAYLSPIMNRYFHSIEGMITGSLKVMTSAGHLAGLHRFHPKDGLLSGPAGGIRGAASVGRQSGKPRLVTFDMGGTSTDVSIYDGAEDFAYETSVGGAVIQAPCLAIDTIAAGGGSICRFDGELLHIGPTSAGARPGPACYGAGGPLTVTDVNLLAGRLTERNFSIPLQRDAAERKLSEMQRDLENAGQPTDRNGLIRSLLQLTTEKMAGSIRQLAIRKGVDTSGLNLIAFGGAGGQHACDLAEELSIQEVLIPYDAGLLSAHGIRTTEIAQFEEKEIQQLWEEAGPGIRDIRDELFDKGKKQLVDEGYESSQVYLKSCFLYLRFTGQESTLEINYSEDVQVMEAFAEAYRHLFGHWLEHRQVEITSIKVIVSVSQEVGQEAVAPDDTYDPEPADTQEITNESGAETIPVYMWEELREGAIIRGPALLGSTNCTVFMKRGWELILDNQLTARLHNKTEKTGVLLDNESANLALFTNRFSAIVEEMGAILQRTSFSVNVKERVDFSCAMLDAEGRLVVNAPHIPVHLGSMGMCVREVIRQHTLEDGDVIITNHPKYGGSHLPDITLISPVFVEGKCIAYLANRAHHAEIGGKTPGSMPPDATTLKEEGIIIPPTYLLRQGEAHWKEMEEIFSGEPYPSRAVGENLADLRGALASIQSGIRNVHKLCRLYGRDVFQAYMDKLYEYAAGRASRAISILSDAYTASELLDDGSALKVRISKDPDRLTIDFTGTAGTHPGNLNATPAIVRSVVLYVMRLLIEENLPLNEGILKDVDIILPAGLLNPDFESDPLPAVAGGNTEVSQRLTDTLLKALGLAACSYGTMNNVVFGNDSFGFYETICGGTGAGPGFNGCDAVHQHMTNTRITDPEIIELRYPVRLEAFMIRENSGGAGRWSGGNGVIRRIRFLEPVELSVLTQHRVQVPYGMRGGSPGSPGKQYLIQGTEPYELSSVDYVKAGCNDVFVIETPGGGGWGDQEG